MAHLEKVEYGSRKRKLHKLEENAKTQKTDEDIFIPATIIDSETKISEVDNDVIDKTNLKGRISCAISENIMENRISNVLNAKYRTDLKNSPKQSTSVFSKEGENIISNCVMKIDVDFNSGIDINPPSQSEHKNVQLTEYLSEVECHSEKEDVQKLNNFENKPLSGSEQNNINKSDKVLDSNLSNNNFKFSIDYILGIPGPSNSCENIPLSNFPGQNIEDKHLSIEKTPNERKNSSMSLAGQKKTLSENIEVLEGKDVYRSCQREYKNVEEKRRPSLIDSHEIKHICDVCKEVFTCFSHLEEHYSTHEGYHSTFCRICKKEMEEHEGKGKYEAKFKCCFENCGYEGTRKHFEQHLYLHSIFKLFKCELCRNRYLTKNNLSRHFQTHPKCQISI